MTTENYEEIAQFKRTSIPLIRQIYPSLIASNIVSVQPLSGPSALVYYLNYQYSKINSENSFWAIKNKKKKIWRNINEPWEQSIHE